MPIIIYPSWHFGKRATWDQMAEILKIWEEYAIKG
jgi:hypothetical protein